MTKNLRCALAIGLCMQAIVSFAQTTYRYSVDLNAIQNDQVTVTLQTPQLKTAYSRFSPFPRSFPALTPSAIMASSFPM
jgi:hypothetical protein